MAENKRKCVALLRIQGNVALSRELEEVFKMMHLARVNHATILDDRPSYKGMIQSVKDYSTWGEISPETVTLLLRRRGRLIANRKITDEFVREKLDYKSIDELAKAIYNLQIDFWKIPEIKPVFRLHPPKGGFKRKTNKPYPEGELGYRKESMNQLIAIMV